MRLLHANTWVGALLAATTLFWVAPEAALGQTAAAPAASAPAAPLGRPRIGLDRKSVV